MSLGFIFLTTDKGEAKTEILLLWMKVQRQTEQIQGGNDVDRETDRYSEVKRWTQRQTCFCQP